MKHLSITEAYPLDLTIVKEIEEKGTTLNAIIPGFVTIIN